MERRFQRVGVLLGGPSAEREVSLRSGTAIAGGLREAGYDVTAIDLPGTDLDVPEGVEAVFIALHGTFGEDGTLQGMLVDRSVPYTGSGPLSSRKAFDKGLTKQVLDEQGIATPRYEVLRRGEQRRLRLPVVVKPPRQGSSIGLHRVVREEDWAPAFADSLRYDEDVLVEEFIEGTELTVGIVGAHVLPVLEIRAPEGNYDYAAKYTSGLTEYLVPAPLPDKQAAACRALAHEAYQAMGCSGFGRVDLRMRQSGEPFVLEVNTIPGFTQTSLLPKAARAAGMEFPDLCMRIMETAGVTRA